MSITATLAPDATSSLRVVAFYRLGGARRVTGEAAKGNASTTGSGVGQARPNFVGHYQPHLPTELPTEVSTELPTEVSNEVQDAPAELGGYETHDIEAQATLARSCGIDAFCYLCAWTGAPTSPEAEIDEIRTSSPADFPFCVCWDNANLDPVSEAAARKASTRRAYSHAEALAFIRALIPAFSDRRYLRIDGRPLVILCDPTAISDLAAVVTAWRLESLGAGQGDPYLACYSGVRSPPPGFDAAIEFPPSGFPAESQRDRLTITNPAFAGDVRAYRSMVAQLLARARPAYALFRTAIPGWDDTARNQNQGVSLIGSSPEIFGCWVEQIAHEAQMRLAGEERLVFVRSWNEWDVGCHLEPDQRFGRQYLTALRDAVVQARAGVPERPPWPIADASGTILKARLVRSRAEQPVNSQGPRVSVVMPAYNHEKFVGEALDSVLAQTHANLELIVVNDGSRDATGEVLDSFARRCTTHPVTVVHQRNGGAPDAINHGLSLARGEVIALINSDDLYAPTRLARLLSCMSERNARFAFSATSFINDAGGATGDDDRYVAQLRESIARAVQAPDPVYALLVSNIAISSGNFVFQRQLLDATGGFCGLRVCHDWDFILAASYHTPLAFVGEPLYAYRLHGANTFADRGLATRLEIEQLLWKFFRDIERHPLLRDTASRDRFIDYVQRQGLGAFLPARQRLHAQ